MARQALHLGIAANTGTGETLRSAGAKINANFAELAAASSPIMPGGRTYYVATDGSDGNDGLTPSTAFLTIQKAVDTICGSAVTGLGAVTIQIADGTYNLNAPVYVDIFAGGGATYLTLQGNAGTPANVVINATANSLLVARSGRFRVNHVELRCTAANQHCVHATEFGQIHLDGVRFGTSTGANHVTASLGGLVTASAYSIVGSAARHYYGHTQGAMRVAAALTLTGTPEFTSAFAEAESRSALILFGSSYSGSATGKRYNVTGRALINTQSLTLPGNVAGTTSTGGQYN